MFRIKLNVSEEVMSWLDDITDNKGETEMRRIMYKSLRDFVNKWQVPYMRMQTDGFLMIGGKKVKKEDLIVSKLSPYAPVKGDSPLSSLLLGDKLIEKLQQAYSVIKVGSEGIKPIDEWVSQIITEAIIDERANQISSSLQQEESEIEKEETKTK
jgi:hypothetical protein